MSAYLDRLYEEYRRAAKIGMDVMDAASLEARNLTPDEASRTQRAFEDVTRLKAEIDKIKTFEDLRQAGDIFRAQATPVIERAVGRRERSELRDLFARVQDNPGGVALSSMPSDGVYGMTVRALQTQGGSAVETSFADFLTVYERTMTPMLNGDVVTILNRTDGSPLVLPRLTADPAAGGTVTAEAAAITELDATISQVTLNPYAYKLINLWSAELGQDSAINLEDTIAFSTARELSIDIGAHLTTGDGNSKPNGIVTAAGNGGTASGTGTTYGTYFGPTDLVNLFYGLAAPYREAGTWMANATTLAQIRNARSTQGEFLWQPAVSADAPETLLGRPIYENPGMASGSAAKAVLFGDTHRYHVARVVPIRVQASIHYKYSVDQLALRTVERIDGDLTDTDAVKYLINAAI